MLESLSIKIKGLRACNFIQKRPQHKRFPANIAKFSGTPILENIFERLFLYKQPATGIHNASIRIENSCQIREESTRNVVLDVDHFILEIGRERSFEFTVVRFSQNQLQDFF